MSNVSTAPSQEIGTETYRPLSVAAIVALSAALVSVAVLVVDVAGGWAVAAIALGLSIFALWRIGRAPVPLAGRRLAVAGLLISTLSLTALASQSAVRRAWARQEAIRVADQFIDLLRSAERRAAHQLTLHLFERCPEGQSLEQCYAENPQRREGLDRFVDDPPIQQILRIARQATVTLDRVELQGFGPQRDSVGLIYRVELPDDPLHDESAFYIWILLDRRIDPSTGQAFWHVTSCRVSRSADAS